MLETGTGGYPVKRPGDAIIPTSFDEFDLDIRLGAAGGAKPHDICIGTADGTTCAAECEDDTAGCGTDDCTLAGCPAPTGECTKAGRTCATCNTACNQKTCHTCATQCEQKTCAATCETCNTQCNQGTCHTCDTQCQQHTCAKTCITCAGETCLACTHVTCGNQPACKL